MKINKIFTAAATKRFYAESMRVIGIKGITINEFAKTIGTTGSNLNRMDKMPGNFATIENCCLLSKNYGTSLQWLLVGDNQPVNIDNCISQLLKIAGNLDGINRAQTGPADKFSHAGSTKKASKPHQKTAK